MQQRVAAQPRQQRVLAAHLVRQGQFSALWPSSRHLSPKVRAFVDFASERMFNQGDLPAQVPHQAAA